jgi:hypothetical protein
VCTSTRVVRAVVTEANATDTPSKDETSTATATTWSRSRLQSVGIDGPAELNDDWRWHNDWGTTVPAGVQLTLTYQDGQELHLPLNPDSVNHAGKLDELLPRLLLEDLPA